MALGNDSCPNLLHILLHNPQHVTTQGQKEKQLKILTNISFRTSAPPLAFGKRFSRLDRGRIFPLFSRVVREGLRTGLRAKTPGTGLSGPKFSGPVACVDLANSFYAFD
jgi:hypothetical protein